jgi:hypothetical protein
MFLHTDSSDNLAANAVNLVDGTMDIVHALFELGVVEKCHEYCDCTTLAILKNYPNKTWKDGHVRLNMNSLQTLIDDR